MKTSLAVFFGEKKKISFTLMGSSEVQVGSKGDEKRILVVSQTVWLDGQGVGVGRHVGVEWEEPGVWEHFWDNWKCWNTPLEVGWSRVQIWHGQYLV